MTAWDSGVSASVDGASTTINDVQPGVVSAEQFLRTLQDQADLTVYLLRLLSFLMFWGGAYFFFRPVAVAPQLIPCVGDFISGLIGCMLLFATLFFGAAWFLLVTAICWIFFRPMIGIPLLCAAILTMGIFIGMRYQAKKNQSARKPLNEITLANP